MNSIRYQHTQHKDVPKTRILSKPGKMGGGGESTILFIPSAPLLFLGGPEVLTTAYPAHFPSLGASAKYCTGEHKLATLVSYRYQGSPVLFTSVGKALHVWHRQKRGTVVSCHSYVAPTYITGLFHVAIIAGIVHTVPQNRASTLPPYSPTAWESNAD